MSVEWEEADQALIALAEEIIDAHHPHLRDARMGFMYRDKPMKQGRQFVYGEARKVSEKDQVFLQFDFIIWIAKTAFEDWSPETRRALVDRELCHCGGFPGMWQMRRHDVNEFVEIVERHGFWNPWLVMLRDAEKTEQQGALIVDEPRGHVTSVPGNLLDRAKEDPDAVATDLYEVAKRLKAENGGKITISQLQRKMRIGYTSAAKMKDLLDLVGGL